MSEKKDNLLTRIRKKSIARKSRKIKDYNIKIGNLSSELRRSLGDKRYEQLRTGNVENLSLSQRKTVNRINKLHKNIERKKRSIVKKEKKI